MRKVTMAVLVGSLLVALTAGVALARTYTCTGFYCPGTDNKDKITGDDGSQLIASKRRFGTVAARTRRGSLGTLRVEDGRQLTFHCRNSKSYKKLLKKVERASPKNLVYPTADDLKTHKSALVRE